MARRRFVDAPSWLRCGATVQLRDKSLAQCGRYQARGYGASVAQGLCTQHAEMALAGKDVRNPQKGRQP